MQLGREMESVDAEIQPARVCVAYDATPVVFIVVALEMSPRQAS